MYFRENKEVCRGLTTHVSPFILESIAEALTQVVSAFSIPWNADMKQSKSAYAFHLKESSYKKRSNKRKQT